MFLLDKSQIVGEVTFATGRAEGTLAIGGQPREHGGESIKEVLKMTSHDSLTLRLVVAAEFAGVEVAVDVMDDVR